MKIRNFNFKIEARWWTRRFKNVGHLIESWYHARRNGYPAKKLTVIGVTGTDGKTTTTTLIYEILKAAGKPVGMVSTVNAKYVKSSEEVVIDTGLHTTNPPAKELQPLIREMVDEGIKYLVLEVTAHGIDQHRIAGCDISIGVLTNVTRDHLDDFVSMDRYKLTKLKMFLSPSVKHAVLNKDDSSFKLFKSKCFGQVVEYGKINLKEVSPTLKGEYNQYNLGAAAAVAKILGVERMVPAVARNFGGVPGRREEVKVGQKFQVFVDFAHTPNGLESILKQLKKELPYGKQLIAVFGCVGERDTGKRPMMGRIAVDWADRVIITSDDTRSENQNDIYQQIAGGIPANMMNKVIKENDRKKAIAKAFELAKPGDIVLLAGKGHEKSILIGDKETPWSDVEAAKEELKSKL